MPRSLQLRRCGAKRFRLLLYNAVYSLSGDVAAESKEEQSSGDTPEPGEVTLVLLTGHPDVHSPETGDNVHGQDDGTQNSELAENVSSLFLSLVHANVDLREVIAVRSGEDSRSRVSSSIYVQEKERRCLW